MSIGGLLTQPVVWTMTSLDDKSFFEGQFRPTGLSENISAAYSEVGTLGLAQPVVQFVRGNLDTITFTARCWAYSQGLLGLGPMKNVFSQDDIEGAVEAIKNMCRPDEKLGRPHVYVLGIGGTFQRQVVVQSVGGIKYDNMRPAQGGSLRGVTFDITCLRYVAFGEATTKAAESLIYRAKEGDFYETIAANLYNQPLLGEALRRRNPERRDLAQGDPIHVPPARVLSGELDLKPQVTSLKPSERVDELKNEWMDKRAGPWVTTLPEGF
jgi:hypothetical protein